MNVIILIALIFVILSLANKYLKVQGDSNQRYDGINNRFYGEGYTGDVPEPPSDDEGQEDGREDLQDGQADNGRGSGYDETGNEDQEEYVTEETGEKYQAEAFKTGISLQQNIQPGNNAVDQPADRQADGLGTDGSDPEAPAEDAAIYGNIGNEPGVVIDSEVRIDAAMPQDPGKS